MMFGSAASSKRMVDMLASRPELKAMLGTDPPSMEQLIAADGARARSTRSTSIGQWRWSHEGIIGSVQTRAGPGAGGLGYAAGVGVGVLPVVSIRSRRPTRPLTRSASASRRPVLEGRPWNHGVRHRSAVVLVGSSGGRRQYRQTQLRRGGGELDGSGEYARWPATSEVRCDRGLPSEAGSRKTLPV